VTFPGSIDAVTEADVPDAVLSDAAHLHVSSYFLQSRLRPFCARLFCRASAHGVSTSLDPGFDPLERWDDGLHQAIESVDLFLPNEVELLAITRRADVGSALHALRDCRARTIVKRGAAGASTLEQGGRLDVPAFSTTAVDTTGAGDSFNAGFLHAFLRRQPVVECLLAANACGALSTRALGGTGAQPSIDEMTHLVRTALERR
jgi:sugar/nucleoside kinase (ribokinase family)